jgi:cytochrome c oxidase cbb3-type subunit 4
MKSGQVQDHAVTNLPKNLLKRNIDMELTIYHWLIIAAFIGVVIWAFGRKRKARFEKDARIPFEDGKD